MFLRCSWQYRFKYLLHEKEVPKVSMSIGKGGHKALEWNGQTKMDTGTDRPVEEVVQKASDYMDYFLDELPKSEYEKDVEPGEIKDKHLEATRVYRKRDAPGITPVGVEVPFEIDLNPYLTEPAPEPIRKIVGRIDLMYQDKSKVLIDPRHTPIGVEDYKYVTRKKSQTDVNLTPQLSLYGTVTKLVTGKWPTKLGFRQMHPGTTKDGPDSLLLLRDPEHMTPEHLESRMRRLAFQFSKMQQAIKADIFIPTDDPITCSWCPYRVRCQASLVDDFQAIAIREKTSPQ